MVIDSTSLLSKYLREKEGNSLKFMQRMLYLIFSEIVYQRELLPQDHFTEKHILGCTMHVPNMNRDRRQVALHNHLKGAAAAVTDKKMKQYHLMVHKDKNDPSAADEVFIMDVVYADDDNEASMQMSCGEQSDLRVCYSGVEDLQKQTIDIFRCLKKSLSSLEPITRNVSFSFYIIYRDGVDRSYHPAGYGQATRMYELPETAEIGDMGVVHAKDHACLLKLKSMLLEDGFQLMQRNAATQRTEFGSATPSEHSQMSNDKASSLGVFDEHSDWDDLDNEDNRATKDQRSLGVASTRTMRFEQSSLLDKSMSEESEQSMELGTANLDDFITPNPSQSSVFKEPTPNPSKIPPIREDMDTSADTNEPSTFASPVSIVTKKLAAAVAMKKEKEEQAKSAIPLTTASSDRTDSSGGAGSEESKETPQPARRVSLRKRHSFPPKVDADSTGSDEKSTKKAKDSKLSLAEKKKKNKKGEKEQSSGKEADSEPSDEAVGEKMAMERMNSTRRSGSKDKSLDDSVDLDLDFSRDNSVNRPKMDISRENSLSLDDSTTVDYSRKETPPPLSKKQRGKMAPVTPVELVLKVDDMRTPGETPYTRALGVGRQKMMEMSPKKQDEPAKEVKTPGDTIKRSRYTEE